MVLELVLVDPQVKIGSKFGENVINLILFATLKINDCIGHLFF
jgi:hypothetical protein